MRLPNIRDDGVRVVDARGGHPALDEVAVAPYHASLGRAALEWALVGGGLVAFAFVLPLAALCVAATSRGPVFYVQKREGLHGRRFAMLKFRTMRVTASGDGRAGDAEEITAVGRALRRFRLDELPQFLNVLCGDMRVIGPRPYVEEYADVLPQYDARFLVKGGITGAAQIHLGHGGNDNVAEKLGLDLEYVRSASFGTDVRIVLRTIWVMLTGFGHR